MDPRGLRVAVQGFGNVGENAARILHERGCNVMAVSDVNGGILNPQGLDIPAVMEHKKKTGSIVHFNGARDIANAELLTIECDVLIPAALSNQLDANNAKDVKAQFILELANAPTTAAADDILFTRDILLIPDILANAGGVVVSYFEWVQDLQRLFWEEAEVFDRLYRILDRSFQRMLDRAKRDNVSNRMAAMAIGVSTVSSAKQTRGLFP
jgi:glutamate dehydrogenase (NAD(P)+)